MNVLHLLAGGTVGGIERICEDIAKESKNNNTFVFIWRGGEIADRMHKKGYDTIELYAKRLDMIFPAKRIFNLCMQKKIDYIVVHHADPRSYLFALFAKPLQKKIRLISYAHGNPENMIGNNHKNMIFLRKWILKVAFKKSYRVVCISNNVKSNLIKYFDLADKNIDVIYNGISLEKFDMVNVKSSKKKRIIFVGRLIEGKGVQIILNALSKINRIDSWEFIVVGDGPYRQVLEEQSEKLNLKDKVFFLGNVDNVAEQLGRADIFIHACLLEEGFGISIVEAMAAGKICIASNCGAIPEIIEDKLNGFLIPKGDASSLAELLEYILQSEMSRFEQLCKEAKKKANEFSMESYISKLDALLA